MTDTSVLCVSFNRLMDNLNNNNVIGNDVPNPNAQIVQQPDGDRRPLVNPNTVVLLPDGGQPTVGHVP